MPTLPKKIAVIGAGPMGLTAAYELLKKGHSVDIFERDDRIGGMSAAFDFDGTRIERYYHFVCKPDHTLFAYLKELDLFDQLKWKKTHMGFYFEGRLYDWGNPFALLRFPALSLWDKMRYAIQVMRVKNTRDWRPYDQISATQWLKEQWGQKIYERLWRPLFHYKFFEYEHDLSAAWLGTRIRRVALSRKNLFQEQLGYIEGGSEVVLKEMAHRIQQMGGSIHLRHQIEKIHLTRTENGQQKIEGLTAAPLNGFHRHDLEHAALDKPFDAVISTIPLPYLSAMIPGLPENERTKIQAIRNVGVGCVILKLKKPYSRNFWTNIHDPRIEIPGIIEYTQLNPLNGSETILYAPYYMPQTHPKFEQDPARLIPETIAYLQLMRPDWNTADVLASKTHRYEYAQTVCTPNFFETLPPMKSAVNGLFMADTSHYYPEDRSISESFALGAHLAELAS